MEMIATSFVSKEMIKNTNANIALNIFLFSKYAAQLSSVKIINRVTIECIFAAIQTNGSYAPPAKEIKMTLVIVINLDLLSR